MRYPRSRAEQRLGRCRGECVRGCGIWPGWGTECALEPPFEPFDRRTITAWDLSVQGWAEPYQGTFLEQLQRIFLPVRPASSFEEYYRPGSREDLPQVLSLAHYAADDVTYEKAEQFLLALSPATEPLAFELFGIGESSRPEAGPPRIEVRFAASPADLSLLKAQLHSQYPRSALRNPEQDWQPADAEWENRLRCGEKYQDALFVAPLYLASPYCLPIRTYRRFETDPLGVAVAVLDELLKDEWGLLQVLFSRARHPWADNLRRACEDPWRRGHPAFEDLDLRLLEEKLETPLYAVEIRLAANTPKVFSALAAWVHQYEGARNRLEVREEKTWKAQWADDANPPTLSDWRDLLWLRETQAPGMLLSARELAGLVHLPSPDLPSVRLLRVRSQTRPAPPAVLSVSRVVLGDNIHRGEVRRVTVPPEIRARHCYVAGASGTGKSTLLLNMILHDIADGHGVGVLDPHGDLVREVLRRIPEHRVEDVILFDPSDQEYPFALNILGAPDEERERVVAETLMALERYFPASWGPRLERILTYAIHTVLVALPGATLADVERLLTEEPFRQELIAKILDPRLLVFWNTQFKHFPKNAVDPVLNKLSPFLLNRTVRNIVCQRRAAVDFDGLLNEGQVLLANLSTGLLTEKIAGTFGSFLVSKIVNAAFRRARLPEHRRRPWFLYVDEFQAFMNLSVGFERILAEARKYRLVLAGLANQYVGQLSTEVRQAVFGNVGSLVVFRLGVEDAKLVAPELGAFTAEDILNLELGQAIARVGGSASAFNLGTYPAPLLPAADPTERIVARTRAEYARPREDVEEELADVPEQAERLERALALVPSDPSEDDLVS